MTIEEAYNILNTIPANSKLSSLFTDAQMQNILIDKGQGGKLIEQIILGLSPSTTKLDFTNGELKTHGCYEDLVPKESCAICQINSIFDDLIDPNFKPENFYAFQKIQHFLNIGIGKYKRGNNGRVNPNYGDWTFGYLQDVNEENPMYNSFYTRVREEFIEIANSVREQVLNGKNLSSTTAVNKYIQIRTKGANSTSGAIFSTTLNRFVSSKSYAFYFTSTGLKALDAIRKESETNAT